jgi:hypothetical protein
LGGGGSTHTPSSADMKSRVNIGLAGDLVDGGRRGRKEDARLRHVGHDSRTRIRRLSAARVILKPFLSSSLSLPTSSAQLQGNFRDSSIPAPRRQTVYHTWHPRNLPPRAPVSLGIFASCIHIIYLLASPLEDRVEPTRGSSSAHMSFQPISQWS